MNSKIFNEVSTIKMTYDLIEDNSYETNKLKYALVKEALKRINNFISDLYLVEDVILFKIDEDTLDDINFEINKLLHRDSWGNKFNVDVAWKFIGDCFNIFNRTL